MSYEVDVVRRLLSKRLLDIVLSVALIVLCAPLVAFVLTAMALDMLVRPRDRGPFLYRERRISRGAEFDLLKLRTLRLDVLNEAGGHARPAEADPTNLTWAGRAVLKRWYLDELPQLLNILRGQMSLVGPRPWPVEMAERQAREGLDYRYRITAGWTGPAQVSKGSPDTVSYAALDLEYVEACRTWGSRRLLRLDLGLLVETVRVLARGEGLRF
jgi:lipopolysaccharide/colanic/teichoic acid biosynthesis glycosyltransferase